MLQRRVSVALIHISESLTISTRFQRSKPEKCALNSFLLRRSLSTSSATSIRKLWKAKPASSKHVAVADTASNSDEDTMTSSAAGGDSLPLLDVKTDVGTNIPLLKQDGKEISNTHRAIIKVSNLEEIRLMISQPHFIQHLTLLETVEALRKIALLATTSGS
jgi:hypothetical protein